MKFKEFATEKTGSSCPPATQDIALNLKNRQKAIDEYGYGPLNPDLPNTKFWMAKVDEWNLDSAEEAKSSLCGNCAAFDVRQETLDCIAQGIDSDSPADAEGVIDAGELGYCKFLKFKCASRRTCDAWVTGGPLTDTSKVDENLRDWFKEKWVRFGPDGKIRGDCARGDDGEGKPKCLPQSKAHSLGKKGRASAAARKRREDPNPERSGKAINVNTKKKSNEGVAEDQLDEKWSQKYKSSINCSHPKGFSQRAHCAGKKKHNESVEMEMVCEVCGMCETHGDHTNLDEACWKGYHKEGNKELFGKTVPNCVKNEDVAEGLAEARNSLFAFVKQQFPTWPDYVLKDFLYQQAKGIRNQAELDDFLKRNRNDFGKVQWRLEKLPITMDIFTPKTQRMILSREGGSSNPFQVPRDAERHAQQSQMIQQKGVSQEPIIVAKLSNGYDLIEGWHRTIQHLKAFPQGYTGPAWVGYGATYTSESVEQGVAEEQHSCPHCGGELVSEELMNEKKDACYYKVKSRYKVWPSAYASGALVQCRKKGAANWGNKSESVENNMDELDRILELSTGLSATDRAELNEEFDLIESIIDRIAEQNDVDAEAVWADLESLTEDELYAFAVTSQLNEDWQKANKRDKTDGMSQKAVNAYRRENPGSKLKTAVTTKPSKLKK